MSDEDEQQAPIPMDPEYHEHEASRLLIERVVDRAVVPGGPSQRRLQSPSVHDVARAHAHAALALSLRFRDMGDSGWLGVRIAP